MSHLLGDVGGFIGGVSTLDEIDELALLAAIHSKLENNDEYIRLFEFLKTYYPQLSAVTKSAVSLTAAKVSNPQFTIFYPMPFSLGTPPSFNNVSSNESDLAWFQLRRCAYAHTQSAFDEEFKSLSHYPNARRLIQPLRHEK